MLVDVLSLVQSVTITLEIRYLLIWTYSKVNINIAGVASEQLICRAVDVMYRVKAYFKDLVVARKFYDLYDAIEWKDKKEKGIFPRENGYMIAESLMNADKNP